MQIQRSRSLAKPLNNNPEWEAAKSARRNLDHNAAVQESAGLERKYRALWSSNVAPSPVNLNQIFRALTEKRIPFVLTGAHGIGGWTGRPRATHDIDILVKGGRNHARAVKAIGALYSELEVRRIGGIVAFFISGETESVIDVCPPFRADLAQTLAEPVWTENSRAGLRYRIPSLQAALANKYGAMLTLTRDPGKRAIDVGDFTFMVKHSLDEGRQPIDVSKLAALGELVWPDGGRQGIVRLVEQVIAGRPISLESLGVPND
jgi:hypothetical protein